MKWKYRIPRNDLWKDIFVFDCETSAIKDPDKLEAVMEGELVFAVIYTGEEYFRYRWDEIDEIKAKFQELANRGKILVAHNMEFDLLRIFPNLITCSSSYIHRHRFLRCSIPITKAHRKGKKVLKCMDSMNLFPIALSSLGDVIGYPKLTEQIDYTRFKRGMDINEKDWTYCERDCEIVYEAIKFFDNTIHNMFDIHPRLTLASTAFNIVIPQIPFTDFNKKYHQYEMEIDDNLQTWAKEAYKGGMTRALEKGTFTDMEYYDISSSYPHSMTLDLPDPRYSTIIEKPTEECLNELLRNFEGFCKIHIKRFVGDHPYIPFRGDDKLLYYLRDGQYETLVSFPELRFLLEHGQYLFDVISVIYSPRIKSPFRDFIHKMYKLKQDSKKEGNAGLAYVSKILLNSSYGKWAQKDGDEKYIEDYDKYISMVKRCLKHDGKFGKWTDFKQWLDWFNDHWTALDWDGSKLSGYLKTDVKDASHDIFSWAAYITGRSRVRLWEHAQEAVYCDTDSVIIPRSVKIPVGEGLGEWEHEYTVDALTVMGKKWYEVIGRKLKTVQKLGFDNWHEITKKVKGVSIEFDDDILEGSFDFYRMMKSKEALRRKRAAGQFMLVHKDLRQIDDEILPG